MFEKKIHVVSGVFHYEGSDVLKAFITNEAAEKFQRECYEKNWQFDGPRYDAFCISEVMLVVE